MSINKEAAVCKLLGRVAILCILGILPLIGADQQPPLTRVEVRDLVKKNKTNPALIIQTVSGRQVDFDLNREIEKKLRSVGASDEILQAIWKAGPTCRNAKSSLLTSATGKQLEATYEEAMAYQALQNELDPNKCLQMLADFEKRFPASQLLSHAYTQGANAAQEKGDFKEVIDLGEKSVKLDPENVLSLILVALALPQPKVLDGLTPTETTRRLSEAEDYARRALVLTEKVPKKSEETDEQYQKRKAGLISDAHSALGMVFLQRDETDKAITEFQTAIASSPKPNPLLYFRLGEIYANNGQKTEAVEAFQKASQFGANTVLKQYADQRIEELKK
jgi:tetratricopeptide (TPR) repeat protein